MVAFPDTKDIKADARDLAADVAQLKDEIKKLTASIMGRGRDGLHAAQKGGADQLGAWREDVDHLATGLKKQGRHQLDIVQKQIRERPLLILVAALGVAFLVSRLIDRR